MNGPTGPTGADGLMGPIKGVVASVPELPTTGVDQGDLYYVEDDGLYVWDETNGWTALGMVQGPRGATGPAGEQGPAGDAASSYMIIPFASTEAPRTFANNGNPSAVSLLGFGYGDRRNAGDIIDAANYYISIDPSDHNFSLTLAAGNDNKQLVFSLPFDVSIRSIYITVGNYYNFDPAHAVFPYVQLFQAAEGSNSFSPIEGAMAIPETGIGPGNGIPADTMRFARTTGLDIKLAAGTRIGIGAMMQVPGDTAASLSYWLYFTGGIGLTYEPQI